MEYYPQNNELAVVPEQETSGSAIAQGISVVQAEKKHWYSITAMTEAFFPYAGFSYDEIMRRLNTSNIFYFVALSGGHSVGFVDFELKEKSAQILGLAVLEEHRCKGIGAKLLGKAVEEIVSLARERNLQLKSIDLMVSEANPAAQKLYERFGFFTAGKLEKQLWGQDILVYSKKLVELGVN